MNGGVYTMCEFYIDNDDFRNVYDVDSSIDLNFILVTPTLFLFASLLLCLRPLFDGQTLTLSDHDEPRC